MYLMIADEPRAKPTPAERVATARRLFRERYGREPAVICANAAQQTEETTAPERGIVPLGCVWCAIGGEQ